LDIVLGVSMAPASIQMVVVEGESADGATVDEDHIEVAAEGDPTTSSAPAQAIAAILGTREGASDAGLRLSSIGVTWTDQLEAHALRDALAAHKIENVMLVSAFLSAAALTQSVGGAMGYENTAVLFVEPDSASLAVVATADGSIAGVRKQWLDWTSGQIATAELVNMVVGLEKLGSAVGGVFVIGSGVDIAPLKPHLEAATSLDVSMPEEPVTALARGAALASANAPLFVSSTAAMAYSLDPGTGAVDPSALPDHLRFPDPSEGDEGRAYSAVPDDDADAPTVALGAFADSERRGFLRRPVALLGSGIAVLAIGAVVALEIASAVSIRRDSVALQPTPAQQLIVPTQQAPPAPAEVPFAQPKIELPAPAPAAVPKPAGPVIAPAAPAAVAPAPVAPAPVPVPVAPIPAPAAPAHAPPVLVPIPVPIVAAPPILPLIVPPRLAPVPEPQSPWRPGTPPRGQVPGWPPQAGGPVPQAPIQQLPPGLGTPPRLFTPGGGIGPTGPGNWPGRPGGPSGGGPIQAPAPAPVPSGPFGGGGFPGGGFPGGGFPGGGFPGGGFPGGGFPGGGFPRGPVAGPAPAPIPRGPFGGGGFGGGGFGGGGFGGGGGGHTGGGGGGHR
jgi:hypothetical protein